MLECYDIGYIFFTNLFIMVMSFILGYMIKLFRGDMSTTQLRRLKERLDEYDKEKASI